jgi:hypothetical protein
MHIFNITLIQCQLLKHLKNTPYMFRSLNDHTQEGIWSLLKLLVKIFIYAHLAMQQHTVNKV